MTGITLEMIDKWIETHKKSILDDLAGLVEIPSVSDASSDVKPYGQACLDALDYMYSLGRRYGYETENHGDRVGEIKFCNGETKVGIWGHIDVVDVPDPDRWVYPPYKMTVVEDNYIIGRGIQDNKMPVIGTLHAMNCLRDLGYKFRRGYSLYTGTNEEQGMDDAKWFAKNCASPDFSLVPDCGFPVCVAQRGAATVRLSAPVSSIKEIVCISDNPSIMPSETSATLDDGTLLTAEGESELVSLCRDKPNSIIRLWEKLIPHVDEKTAKILSGFIKLCSDRFGSGAGMVTQGLAPTVIRLEGGIMSADVVIVLPTEYDADTQLENAGKAAAAYGITAEVLRLRKPVSFREDNPMIQLLTGVYNGICGCDSKPYTMSGGNYAAYIPNAVGFGPGMPGQKFPEHIFKPGHGNYHQCDESDTIEHLIAFMRIYAMSIMAIDEAEYLI